MPALRSLYTIIALRDQVSEKIKTVNRSLDTYKTRLQVVRTQLQRVNTTLKAHRMHFVMVGAALSAVIGLTAQAAINEEKYRRNIASLIGVTSSKNKVLQDYITLANEIDYISRQDRARLISEMMLLGASTDSIMKYGGTLEKLGIAVSKTTDEVIVAVRASIAGEHTAFKALGVMIKEEDVKGKIEEIADAHEGWTKEAIRTEAIMLLAYPQMTRVIGDFDVAVDTAYGDMIKFKASLSDLSSDIGVTFIPILRAAITPLMKFMSFLKEYPVLKTAAAVSLLSGVVLVLAGLAIPMITSALSFFTVPAAAAIAAAGGLTAAMSALLVSMAPIVLAIAAVAMVLIVLQHAYKRNLFGFADAVKKVAVGVKAAFGIIVKVFKALISGFVVPFVAVFKPILKLFGLFNAAGKESSLLVTVVTAIGNAFKRLHTFLEPHFPLIKKILKVVGALGAVMILLPMLPMVILVKVLVTAIKALIGGVRWLIDMFKSVSQSGGNIAKAMKVLKLALLPLFLPIAAIVTLFRRWSDIKGIVSGIATTLKTKFGDAVEGAKNKIEGLTDAFAKTRTGVIAIDIATKIKEGDIVGVLKSMVTLPRAYLSDIIASFETITNKIGEVFGVENLGSRIIEGIRSSIDRLKDYFGELPLIFYDAGMNMIKAFVDGIKAFATAPVEAIKEIGERIRAFLPFSDAREGPLADLSLAGQKLTKTFSEGMLRMKPELAMNMQTLLSGMPVIGDMAGATTTTTTNNEDRRVSIGKIELHLDGISNNAEEIGTTVINRIKREFEKYGI